MVKLMNNQYIIEKTKDNYDIIKVYKDNKWIYIGSKYNMKNEIEKFMNKVREETNEKTIFLIFGFASGDHIETLSKCYENAIIRIFEPNEEIYEYAIQRECIKNNSNIIVQKYDKNTIDNKSCNLDFMDEFNLNRIHIIPFCNYDKIYDFEYLCLLNMIKSKCVDARINRNTKLGFSKRWFTALNKNLPYIVNSVLLDKYRDSYKNKPAIIISAGPSLDKNVDLLKGIEEEFFLITGGRPLKGLVEKKISPGLVVALDSGNINYELMKGSIEETNFPLLFFEVTNEKIVENHNGYKIFSTYSPFIINALENKINVLETFGSVAHSSTSAAILLGCNPIIFIGQDFAYTNDRAHSAYLEEKHKDNKFEDVKNQNDIYVESIDGSQVRTSRVLNSYRIGMEKIIERNPQIRFINATEGGARIHGTEEMTLKEVIDIYRNNTIEKFEILKPNIKFKETIVNKLEETIECLKIIKTKCNKADKYVKVLECGINKNAINQAINELDKIDLFIKDEIIKFSIVESLLYPIVYSILSDNSLSKVHEKKEKRQIIVEQSKRLYTYLRDTIDINLEEIEKTLAKIQEGIKDYVK